MSFPPVVFDAPPVNPLSNGLFAATQWPSAEDPPRWFDGVEVRPYNYGGSNGQWQTDWNSTTDDLAEGDIKKGVRPDILDKFERVTAHASDGELVEEITQDEANARALQNLRLNAPITVEKAFAARMISDSPVNPGLSDIVAAVGWLEMMFAKTNTPGFIHASAQFAAQAADRMLIVRSGTGLKTPLGNTWVFGGGYEDVLGLKIAGTSQPFGWRTEPMLKGDHDPGFNKFKAVAEQSFVIGYETMIGFVDLSD